MNRFFKFLLCLNLVTAFALAEQVYIKIGEAKTKKSLIALPPLQYIGSPAVAASNTGVGAEIFNVITNDLDVSGYFQFISQSAFVEDTKKTSIKPFLHTAECMHFFGCHTIVISPFVYSFVMSSIFISDYDFRTQF